MKNNGGADGSDAEILDVATAIADAIVEHDFWLRAWHRAVTCGLSPGENVTGRQAHAECRFGRWLERKIDGGELQDELLERLARAHRHLHDVARRLAERAATGGPVSSDEYDAVMHAVTGFREAAARAQDEYGGADADLAPDDRLNELEGRLTILNELERERERALRTGMPATLLFVRPDGLDSLEEEHGQAGLDRMVVSVAARLFAELRPYDGIYRYGRCDFMVCLPGTSTGQASRIAERLLATIVDSPVALADDAEVAITARIGIAGIDERTSVQEAVDHAVRVADLAVAGGGDAIVVWDPLQSG